MEKVVLDTSTVADRTLEVVDVRVIGAKIQLNKIDASTKAILPGADLELYAADDTLICSFTSDKDGITGKEIFQNITEAGKNYINEAGFIMPGSYYIVETKAPADYKEADPDNKMYFTVKKDFTIEEGMPKYTTFEVSGVENNQQWWARGSASGVTSVEIELRTYKRNNHYL